MTKAIRTRIVELGDDRGICVPQSLLDRLGIDTEVDIEIEGDRLVIRSASRSRVGWEEKFKEMAERKDDRLLDEEIPTNWDETEWQW